MPMLVESFEYIYRTQTIRLFQRPVRLYTRYATSSKPDWSHLCPCWLNRLNTYRTRGARLFRRPVRFYTRYATHPNLTGLIYAYADWIVWIHIELGAQDYSEDLSGFIYDTPPHLNLTGLIYACADWILWIYIELGTQDYSEDLSGFIRDTPPIQTWQVLSMPVLIEAFEYI